MSVNSYLQDLGSSLVLSSNEKSSITTSIDTIKSRLTTYFGEDVIDKIIFGSYTRETILPRKADENSDIDLMVVFKNPYSYKPQSFLNKLKNFAEAKYSTSEIHQSSPTIVLELNHIKFELVPTYTSYDQYYIPKNSSEWMYTNPNDFNNKLVECNKNNSYKIKPVVRLLKYWNIQKNSRDLCSYELESKIANEMTYSYISCTSYTDYLKSALGKLRTFYNSSKIDNAISKIDEALQNEQENYPYTAMSKIKEVFPEV
ncbi:SMODS domain-containing nucleotidyltransferase [Clostridium diolis]|uniref:SMODS domain-containing nucleotidyltransferase n=1 Tax=Clostridium diolis TaxID=223919 RepID=UPI003AF58097